MLTTSHYTINLRISAAIPLASAPAYGRFPRFHHGCTALQPTWQFLHRTFRPARCWSTAGSLFLRHSGMGAMAGLSMIEPFGVRQRWIHLCLGIRSYHSKHPPIWGGSFARFAASPITQPVSVPFQLSSLLCTLIVADCCSGLE